MNDIKTKRALDRALISLGSGDADSLEAVYELSARRLYSVCYLITGNREDAEDALHNAMLRICRYAPDYKSQNGAWASHSTLPMTEGCFGRWRSSRANRLIPPQRPPSA